MFLKKELKENNPAEAPVYIIGSNALSCFLAARLIDAGENPVIIADKDDNLYLNTNGITIKDDLSLEKKHYSFTTSFLMKEEPKLTIISTDNYQLKSLLTTVSKNKIKETPVLLFSYLKDIRHIKALLGKNVYQCYFEGWLDKNDQIIEICGRAPEIKIAGKEKESLNEFLQLFNLRFSFSENKKSLFWQHFSSFAVGSLLSAGLDKNLADIIGENNHKDLLMSMCGEIAAIAKKEQADISEEELLKTLYQTPGGYACPLQKTLKAKKIHDIDLIASQILSPARKHKIKIPELRNILKNIHKLVLG